jgi:hypothetical protein
MDGLGVAMEEAATCPVLAPRERLRTTGHDATRYCHRMWENVVLHRGSSIVLESCVSQEGEDDCACCISHRPVPQ